MGWQILKNPETNEYQVFSSVVDDFITDHEYTKEELTEFWLQQFGEAGQKNFERILAELDKPDGKPYHQFTMTWDEAMMWHTHQTKHGPRSRQPDTCNICKDIASDEAEDRKNGK